MNIDALLKGIQGDLQSEAESAKERIHHAFQQKLQQGSPLFTEIHSTLKPKKSLKSTVWKRISSRITSPEEQAMHALQKILTPNHSLAQQIRNSILLRLQPVSRISFGFHFVKWVAAFAVFGLFVRMSPMLFIASPTVAESEALLVPTRGEVSVSIGGLWQTVERDLVLEPGMKLRTHDGEASIILHDDGVVRLDKLTTVEITNLSDHLESSSDDTPTLTLFTGRVWLQGLVPSHFHGITVATTHGTITVNEGSVSIAEDDIVEVDVYDRSAVVHTADTETFLTEGERVEVSGDGPLLVKKIPEKWFQRDWADQNLKRDAVHRHDIAQQQHERRIARAGILPTSPLYSVKRIAEQVDVMLTFNEESRVQKQLQQAETRLNEAAALIYEGEEAGTLLDEYQQTVQRLAAEGKDASLADFLVQRAIAEATAQISAVLPGDEAYPIKQTVLETSAQLPNKILQEDAVKGTLLLDNLAVMVRSADEGNTEAVEKIWSDLQPYLSSIENEDSSLDPAMQKEARTLLAFLAESLHVADTRGAEINPELLSDLSAYMPLPIEPETVVVQLSEEEIMDIVQTIKEKIFVYDMTQSRINQFIFEMKSLQNHPDFGRILRRLAQVLPQGPEQFPDRVYREIVRLRWEKAAEENL